MKAVVITCAHVGRAEANTGKLAALLRYLLEANVKQIVLAGDFFDLWEVKAEEIRGAHRGIIQLLHALRGHVVYLLGNHDEAYLKNPVVALEQLPVKDAVTIEEGGRRIAVIHGHQYDWVYKRFYWLYRILHNIRRAIGWVFGRKGAKSSLSAYQGLGGYERAVSRIHFRAAETYRKMGFDGLVMGHTHVPASHTDFFNDFDFANAGDWLTGNSFVAIDERGHVRVLRWKQGAAVDYFTG
jgi:UDP-2,3-diacylglucosamine pyrophosphatase LpxH